MNKEQKEKILKEVNKMSRPVTEGILAVLNHRIGTDKTSYENYQKLLQEEYYTEEHIRKAIEETSKHYEEKLTQTNLRNHSREKQMKKSIDDNSKLYDLGGEILIREGDKFDRVKIVSKAKENRKAFIKKVKEIIQKHLGGENEN